MEIQSHLHLQLAGYSTNRDIGHGFIMWLINLARLPTRHYVAPYIRLSSDWSGVAFYPLLRDNREKSTDGNRKNGDNLAINEFAIHYVSRSI
jgi:hypothetical protein